MVAFAAAATVGSALLFGVLPAWQVTTIDAGEPLKEHSRSATVSIRGMRWGRFLVSLQLGLSLPLLVGAGLLARTLYNLQRVDLGYPAERSLLVRIDTREAGYMRSSGRLVRDLLEQFRRIGRPRGELSRLVIQRRKLGLRIEVEGYSERRQRPRLSHLRSGFRLLFGPGSPHCPGTRHSGKRSSRRA